MTLSLHRRLKIRSTFGKFMCNKEGNESIWGPWESPAQEPDIWRLCHVKFELGLVDFFTPAWHLPSVCHLSSRFLHPFSSLASSLSYLSSAYRLLFFFSSSLTTGIAVPPTPPQPVTSSFVQFDQPFVFLSASHRQHVNPGKACRAPRDPRKNIISHGAFSSVSATDSQAKVCECSTSPF